MKISNRTTVLRLEELPNIGKAIAGDLRLIGVDSPKELIGKNPLELYVELCEKSGKRHDPCVIDVFMAVVRFMEGGDALPWWAFTEERKGMIAEFRRAKEIVR
jgi:hypothetical protein